MHDHEIPREYIISPYSLQFIYKFQNIVLIYKSQKNNITVTHLYAHKYAYIHNTIHKYKMNTNIMKIHCTN